MKSLLKRLLIASLLFSGGCKTSKLAKEQPTYLQLYEKAVKDAMFMDSTKLDTSLVEITPRNRSLRTKVLGETEFVLVVTWQSGQYNFPDSGKFTTDSNRYTWVTIYPELLERMSTETFADETMRLRQLLGLPPNKMNRLFIEFYVKKEDLVRPCLDKEITDKTCELCPDEQSLADGDHTRWINNLRILNYFGCELYSRYPWTCLGYTYDWHPGNVKHRGLSEFVVRPNSTVYITGIFPTAVYLDRAIF